MFHRTNISLTLVFVLTASVSHAQTADERLRGLIGNLRSAQSSVVEKARTEIKKIGTPAIPYLNDLLKNDTSSRVRREAVLGLMRVGSFAQSSVVALSKALDDRDPGVREAAVMALQSAGSNAKSAVPALITLFNNPQNSSQIRSYCVSALGRIGSDAKEVQVFLANALKRDSDSHVRISAAQALAHATKATNTTLPALQDALKNDKDGSVRRFCVYAISFLLGNTGVIVPAMIDAMTIPALSKAIQKDKDGEVRSLAIDAIRAIGGDVSALVPIIALALRDNDSTVRLSAENTLAAMGQSAVAALQAALNSEKDSQAAQSLRQIIKRINPKL
ncbi:MAG: HEAT repeat domain-containing protein [Armatimonadetes bacterium]|nr:HEAT repeat domain-containing protein [Armatimonadota bacterium]